MMPQLKKKVVPWVTIDFLFLFCGGWSYINTARKNGLYLRNLINHSLALRVSILMLSKWHCINVLLSLCNTILQHKKYLYSIILFELLCFVHCVFFIWLLVTDHHLRYNKILWTAVMPFLMLSRVMRLSLHLVLHRYQTWQLQW